MVILFVDSCIDLKTTNTYENSKCVLFFQTDQGIKNLTADAAAKLQGTDPDYATRDLYNAIAEGNPPSWSVYIQIMSPEEAEKFRWNPFDLTKVNIKM